MGAVGKCQGDKERGRSESRGEEGRGEELVGCQDDGDDDAEGGA